MKRLVAVAAVAAGVLCQASSAQATIHPIMVGWVCGSASGNPPGQPPGETHADQSTLRAVQATGLLTFTSSRARHERPGVEVHDVRPGDRGRHAQQPWRPELRRRIAAAG
jgi:hypothetical protein